MTLDFILGHMNYWLFIILMMTGFYIVVSRGNFVKKIVGLNVFQVSVFMFYISIGKVTGGDSSGGTGRCTSWIGASPWRCASHCAVE